MSNDEQVSPAIEWVNNLERDQLLAECGKRHILPDSPSARTKKTLAKRLRDFVCEHGVDYIPPPKLDPSGEPDMEAQGLPTIMVIALRFARDQITSDKAIAEITRLAGIAASAAAQAALLVILTKLRERKLSTSEAEAEINEIAIEHPAQPEQPIVPPVVQVKVRKDYDPDPAVAEREIQFDINTGVVTGENGSVLLREVRAEIQPEADPIPEPPPASEEDNVSDHDQHDGPDAGRDQQHDVHVDLPYIERSAYPRDPKLAREAIRKDVLAGIITVENGDDLIDLTRQEDIDQAQRLWQVQNPPPPKPLSGGKDTGGNDDTRRPRVFGSGRGTPPPQPPRNGHRQRDNDPQRQPWYNGVGLRNTMLALAALLVVVAAGVWLIDRFNDDDIAKADGNDTPGGTATQPAGGSTPAPTQPPANPGGKIKGQNGREFELTIAGADFFALGVAAANSNVNNEGLSGDWKRVTEAGNRDYCAWSNQFKLEISSGVSAQIPHCLEWRLTGTGAARVTFKPDPIGYDTSDTQKTGLAWWPSGNNGQYRVIRGDKTSDWIPLTTGPEGVNFAKNGGEVTIEFRLENGFAIFPLGEIRNNVQPQR